MKGKKIVASLALALGAFSGLVACDKTEEKPEVKEPVTYTVIFKNGDVELSNEEIEQGDFYKIPANPTAPEGKYFVGWDGNNDGNVDELKAATADITYVAVFADKNIEVVEEGSDAKTISFKNEAGDVIGVVLYVPGQENEVVEPQVPVKVGYDGSWANYELNGDNIEVSPVYSLHQYRVSFVADGKQIGVAQYNIENKNINVPAVPAKEGYTGAWEEYVLDSGDKVVNAVYTKNPISVNDILGTYYNGQESLYIGYDSIVLHMYNEYASGGQGGYVDREYYTEEIYNNPDSGAEYYYKIEGDIINLYNYMDQVEKSYQIVGNDVVAITDKLQISTWGTYEYKVDGQVVSQLLINEEGISYIVGDKVYDAAIELENDAISIRLDDEDVQFNLNSNYNYELDLADGAQEFVKVVPQEWYGTYYYANNYPNQVVINDSSLNQLKLVKDGFKYQGTTFIVTESGTLNYLDYSGNIHLEEEYENGQVVNSWPAEYVKLQEIEVPESLYGTYRNQYSVTIIISAEGVNYYELIPMDKVSYSEGVNSQGEKICMLNVDGSTYVIGDGYIEVNYQQYFISIPGDVSELNKEIPSDYDPYKDIILEAGENTIEISGNSISYNKEGYESLVFYVDSNNAIHIFKNEIYKLVDEVILEIVDGKLVLNGSEVKTFNVDLADIVGVYINGENQISISADKVQYLEQEFAVADIEINAYNIKLSDSITLIYNPDDNSVSVSDVEYNYSSTLTLGIPTEWYESYWNEAGTIVIDETGVYYKDSWGTSYPATITNYDASSNLLEFYYEQYGAQDNLSVTYQNGMFVMEGADDKTINYVVLPEQSISADWVGYYEGVVSDQWGDYHYNLKITEDSIVLSYVEWNESYSDYIIISENTIMISNNSYKLVFSMDADGNKKFAMTGSNSCDLLPAEEQGGDEPVVTQIPSEWIGTWTGTDNYSENWILSITEDSISCEYTSFGTWLDPISDYVIDGNTFSFSSFDGYVFTYADNQISVSCDWDPSFSAILTIGK